MFVLRKIMVDKDFLLANLVVKYYSTCINTVSAGNRNNDKLLSDLFNKPHTEITQLLDKQPVLRKYDEQQIMDIVNICEKYSISKENLFRNPKLFGLKAITLQHHADILLESGFSDVTPSSLLLYITLITRRPIGHLKTKQLIRNDINVQENLLNSLRSWPTSPAMSKIYYNDMSLHTLRMKILSRYLELNIDLPQEDFEAKLKTYPRIKHRPFKQIDDLLDIFQNKIGLSNKTICNYFGIFEADPDNIRMMQNNVLSLSGINLRDLVIKRPTIMNRNWKNIENVQNVLNENNISYEAQRKCLDVYLLDYKTVAKRLEDIKSLPEYHAFIHHPKIVKLILYKNKADKRLEMLKNHNKQCVSINVLSGCDYDYLSFAHSQGDVNRGRDAKSIIQSLLDNKYSYNEISSVFQPNGCLKVVPLENFKTVHDNIKHLFTTQEIFENCHILLFPWETIKKYLELLICLKFGRILNEDKSMIQSVKDLTASHVDVTKLSMSSILSLILYFIEKEYNFSGAGIWDDGITQLKANAICVGT